MRHCCSLGYIQVSYFFLVPLKYRAATTDAVARRAQTDSRRLPIPAPDRTQLLLPRRHDMREVRACRESVRLVATNRPAREGPARRQTISRIRGIAEPRDRGSRAGRSHNSYPPV